jgi:hypothetical protein
MMTAKDSAASKLAARATGAAVLSLLVLGAAGAGAVTVQGSANVNVSVNMATNGSNTNALQEVGAAAAQTAQSAELQGAVKSVWRMAWEKSWPFIKATLGKFWNLLAQAWQSLVSLGKTPPPATNANANAAVNAATNTAP